MCMFTPTTCVPCMERHGTIYPFDAQFKALHMSCLCKLVPMRCITAGNATNKKDKGVDLFLKYTGVLPAEYITTDDAKNCGWKPKKGNFAAVLPDRVIGGDVYYNRDGKLPQANGRIWHEADFDYNSGYRNTSRILYSSDGLIFVTYDHYKTFYEIK